MKENEWVLREHPKESYEQLIIETDNNHRHIVAKIAYNNEIGCFIFKISEQTVKLIDYPVFAENISAILKKHFGIEHNDIYAKEREIYLKQDQVWFGE